MKNLFILIVIILNPLMVFAEYSWPIRFEKRVTGTFGEYRGGRFHHGIDISCNASKGLKVIAADKGYVSSIMYQKYGIGYAVFLTHSTGERTLYGHMNGFSSQILKNKEVKKYYRYILNRKDFRINFKKNEIPVKRGALVGYSGDSGLGHEHLHFEIRDTSDKSLNPLRYGLSISDKIKPVLKKIYLVPLEDSAHINGKNQAVACKIIKEKKGIYRLEKNEVIEFGGKIGLKITAYDYAGYKNRVAPYGYSLSVNNSEKWRICFDKLDRKKGRQMGLYYDYDNSSMSSYTYFLFSRVTHQGSIISSDFDENVLLKVACFDTHKNNSELIIKLKPVKPLDIKEKVNPNLIPGRTLTLKNFTSFSADFSKESALYKEKVTLLSEKTIPFYKKGLIKKSKAYSLNPANLYLDEPINIKLKYSGCDYNKIGIYKVSKNGYPYFISNEYDNKEKCFVVKTRRLGKFILIKDNIPPQIVYGKGRFRRKKTKRFKYKRHIRLFLKDKGSGINLRTVYLRVDKKRVIWDYDPDNRCIEILSHNHIWKKGRHKISIKVKDRAGNSSKLKIFYYRYK